MEHLTGTAKYDGRAPAAYPGKNLDFWPVESLASWRDAPLDAAKAWLAQQRILGTRAFRESSVDTYTAMASVWLNHLSQRNLTILEATSKDATSFFETKVLEPISRRRYLQLLDRVYRHLEHCGRIAPNPIQVELQKERELVRSLPPSLSDEQQDALIDHLEQIAGWKGARDRGISALLLGAGLRTNELIHLTLNDVTTDFRVLVQPKSVHRPHETLISPEGPWRAWYEAWVAQRAEKMIPGFLVAPTTPKGNSFDPSGLFRRVRSWLDDANIDAAQSGPNILRCTFARTALLSGRFTLRQVQEFLGHHDARATERHKSNNI